MTRIQGQSVERERERERFVINQTRVVGSLTSFRARGFRDRDFFFLCGHRTNLVSPDGPHPLPRGSKEPLVINPPRGGILVRAVPVPQGYLFFFFFLHHLDLSVLPEQLLRIVYSCSRVSLEPSNFSMMAEIVCMV